MGNRLGTLDGNPFGTDPRGPYVRCLRFASDVAVAPARLASDVDRFLPSSADFHRGSQTKFQSLPPFTSSRLSWRTARRLHSAGAKRLLRFPDLDFGSERRPRKMLRCSRSPHRTSDPRMEDDTVAERGRGATRARRRGGRHRDAARLRACSSVRRFSSRARRLRARPRARTELRRRQSEQPAAVRVSQSVCMRSTDPLENSLAQSRVELPFLSGVIRGMRRLICFASSSIVIAVRKHGPINFTRRVRARPYRRSRNSSVQALVLAQLRGTRGRGAFE